jgi:hypothetical protein
MSNEKEEYKGLVLCDLCGKEIPADKIQEHLEKEHPSIPSEEVEIQPQPSRFSCPYCEEKFSDFQTFSKHLWDKHPEEQRKKISEGRRKQLKEKREGEVKEILEGTIGIEKPPPIELPSEKEEEIKDPKQLVALLGREGLNRLKRKTLEEELNSAPGITPEKRKWVLRKWDRNPSIRDDPRSLFHVMVYEAAIPERIATSILQDVFSLEQEYANELLMAGSQPIIFGGITPERREFLTQFQTTYQQPQLSYQPSYTYQPQYRPQPYGPTPPQPPIQQPFEYLQYPYMQPIPKETITKEDIIKTVKEVLREEKERSKLDMLGEEVNELRAQLSSLIQRIEEGKIGKKEEEREKYTKELKEIEERLRKEIEKREEMIDELRKEMSDKERQALLERIEKQEETIKELAKKLESYRSATGYQTDSYRLIGQSLEKAVEVVKEKAPLESVARMIFGEKVPPKSPAQTKESKDILTRLEAEGLVKEE